jgi:hypothetical protein
MACYNTAWFRLSRNRKSTYSSKLGRKPLILRPFAAIAAQSETGDIRQRVAYHA